MSRHFTLADCERLLPDVERALRDAMFHRAEYQRADGELDASAGHIRMSGGARLNRDAYLASRTRRDSSAAALKDAFDRIEQIGALVKDLETGLIDFLSLYHGQEVCLCWKLGEDRIRFWHGIEEGFRGRKAIDDEFLANHRGDSGGESNIDPSRQPN
ncbi:MAG TPA: DUF2203 domain-containing protein [Bryobacteraceae bacterium]|nr:DUF2203 domain-containing protein [Bryobacteraceae bacterium]